MCQGRQHAAGVADGVGGAGTFRADALVAQTQIKLPLWRDFPFVLNVKSLPFNLRVKGLTFEGGQKGRAIAICGGAPFLTCFVLSPSLR